MRLVVEYRFTDKGQLEAALHDGAAIARCILEGIPTRDSYAYLGGGSIRVLAKDDALDLPRRIELSTFYETKPASPFEVEFEVVTTRALTGSQWELRDANGKLIAAGGSPSQEP